MSLFDRAAPVWDVFAPRLDPGAFAAGVGQAERPIERVLDVGGGTGRGARAIAATRRRRGREPLGESVVVDVSRPMLEQAHGRGHGVIRGDGTRLPVASASVDLVVFVDALHHVTPPTEALAEAARVLRPGGVVVVRDFDPTTRLGRLLVAGERLIGFGSVFITPEAVEGTFARAGLEAVVLDRGFEYTVAGVRATNDW